MKEEKNEEKAVKDLFGIETDMSLQSVHFATPDNRYLNEHMEEENE